MNKDAIEKPSDFLFQIIKAFVPPIFGFFGGLVSIYEFIKYWRSDSLTINWILIVMGLVLWFVWLLWVGFSTKKESGFYVGTGTLHDIPKKRFKVFRIAQIALLISIVVVSSSAFAYKYHVDEIHRIRQSKVVVLIASFDGPEAVYGVQNELIENLRTETSKFDDVLLVPIEDVITPLQGGEYAKELGKKNDADIVVWGWYRPTENTNFTVHVELLFPEDYSDIVLKESQTIKPSVPSYKIESFEWQQEFGVSTSAFVTFMSGLLFYNKEDYSEAVNRFDQAFELASASDEIISRTPILLYRGGAKIFLEDYMGAVEDFDYVLQNDPKTIFAYYVYNDRGATYARMGDFEQAFNDYNAAIQLNQQEFVGYVNRGLVYARRGQLDLAVADFDKAIAINSDFAFVFYNRGVAHYAAQRFDKAIDDFTKSVEIIPNFSAAYINRGYVYDYLGEHELALADFSEAIRVDPENITAYINRGVVYANLKRYDEALDAFSRCIEIDQEYAACYLGRGLMYSDLGETQKAQADLKKYDEIIAQLQEQSQ